VFLPQEKGMNGMRINPRVMHSREARVATLQHSCSSGKQRERQLTPPIAVSLMMGATGVHHWTTRQMWWRIVPFGFGVPLTVTVGLDGNGWGVVELLVPLTMENA